VARLRIRLDPDPIDLALVVGYRSHV
jgi:hypothetical protein